MNAMEWMILLGFGIPIVGLCALFCSLANSMMRAEALKAQMWRDTLKARRYEAMRRKVRGTPSKRPGGYAMR